MTRMLMALVTLLTCASIASPTWAVESDPHLIEMAAFAPPPKPKPGLGVELADDAVLVEGRGRAKPSTTGAREPNDPSLITAQPAPAVVMLPACPDNSPNTGTDVQCAASGVACPQGMTRLFVWSAPAGTVFGQPGWRQSGTTCGEPGVPGAAVVVPALSAEDFQRLPLPAGVAGVQPSGGRVLVRVPTNVYVTVGPVVLDTTVLGFAVRVRATPSRFSWDFGDGTVLPTRDPGAPYPDLRVSHPYAARGEYGITLTTFYSGEYSVAGGPWLPVPGEAEVASATVAVQAFSGRNELVADTLP